MTPQSLHRGGRALAATAVVTLALAGCGNGGSEETDDGPLLMWSLEVQPDRVAATQKVLDEFTKKTGTEVELVPVEEAQVNQLLSAAALSDEMPDVIAAVPLGLVQNFAVDDYLDRDAATEVVEALGEDTFNANALTLTREEDEQLSVPSDAWAQILVYRKDLFEEAGLQPPTDYDTLRAAAEALTGDGRYGITIATDAADAFTQQTFEALALGNGCQLVDDQGQATLDSPACTATINLYGELASKFSPSGTQTVDSTRAAYFAGQAAMTIWSTFLLDELAGLRNDAMPSCNQCKEPGWLAENSGIVPVVSGPDTTTPGAFGEITSWVITQEANSAATDLVQYMLSDGYTGWLAQSPEGKVPVRTGTEDNPTEYVDAWADLEMGVDTRATMADVYPPEVVDTLTSVADDMDRWALPQGQGELLGPLTAELPLARIVADLGSGSIDPTRAQQQMQDAVTEIADS